MNRVQARPFRHTALFYSGMRQFLHHAVPFIRDGVAAREPVLVVVEPHKILALQAELGEDAEEVRFADMTAIGRNPARLIPAWQRFIESQPAGRPMRGLGEPVSAARAGAELVEAQAHESLLNVAFGETSGLDLLCPYDIGALRPEVLAEAKRSHPTVNYGDGLVSGSDTYLAEDPCPARMDQPLPLPPLDAKAFTFDDSPGALGIVRSIVWQYAIRAGLNSFAVEGLTVAANEVATNSVRHGSGGGTLRMWTEDGTVVCEINDAGRLTGSPLVGRRLPPLEQLHGRGLWLANQLCDLVQIRSTSEGTTVRLHMDGERQ